MERPSTPRDNSEGRGGIFVSCGECLNLKLPWRKRRNYTKHKSTGSICDVTTTLCPPIRKQQSRPGVGGFKYDPLSYAQNFDDSAFDKEDEEFYFHGFSYRFAAPASKSSSSSSTSASS